MVAVTEPGAVIGGEHDERVIVQPVAFDSVEDLADRPVEFHHNVAKQSGAAFVAEFIGDGQRHMDHRVRHVEKERPIFVPVDEADSVLGVERR